MNVQRAGRAAALTDPGLTRSGNEDALLVEPPLYAVADGMGGHRAGEIASSVALQALLDNAPRVPDGKALSRAVRAANRAVIESAARSKTRSGMGTTLTAAMVDGTSITIAHVGDSRAYVLHAGKLTRVTEDHSMVAGLVRQGTISEEEARFHPQRSVITRALGSDPDMPVDVYEVLAAPGDRLLLCSDGLTGMLTDSFIAEVLTANTDPGDAVQKLVDAANHAGGYDNISVILVDLSDTGGSNAPVAGSREATRRRTAPLLWVVAAVALIGVTAWGAVSYARSRAYLIDEAGYVAVYRGIPGSFAGLRLSWPLEVTDVPVDTLDLPQQTRLREGIEYVTTQQALTSVQDMRARYLAPVTTPATGTPSVEPTSSPSTGTP